MSPRRPKICVLGKEDRAFLAVVRSFGRRGAEVHLCWTPPDALARRSRYVARVHDDVPLYSPHDEAWKAAFIALLERERFDLVVPTNDATIIPLQAHRAEIELHGRIYLIPDRAFEVCFDKEKSYALAASLDVPLPRQHVLTLPVGPDAIDPSWYPLVLKPHASFTLDDLKQKHFVRKVRRPEQLAEELAHFEGAAEVLVQQHFHGTGAGIEMLAVDGEILVALQHLRVHERRKGGADSYRVTLPIRDDMYQAAARMVRALDYTGVIMFELKLNLATQEWVLIEINARFWASLPLCLHARADFPWWLYEALVLGRREFPRDYRVGVYCRNWGRDLVWLKENFQAPPDERVGVGTLLSEVGPWLRGREASDTFALDDPAPGLEDLRRLGARGANRVRRLFRRVGDHAPGVQARRAARARHALANARDVLFVCKGNICRSPFAEAYLRQRLNGSPVHVHSAGYHPKRNRPCPDEAVAAAREIGTDLYPHRSRILDAAMVRAADAIFTFDQENYTTVLARHPEARRKVHRLSALGGVVEDVRDPYGGAVDEFRRTYERIRRALDSALDG